SALVPVQYSRAAAPAAPPHVGATVGAPRAQYAAPRLRFELNAGQTNPQARFLARSRDGIAFLSAAEIVARVVGLDRLPGVTNYLIGNDSSKWRTNVPGFARVKYEGIYPGVDLVYYGNQVTGDLAYNFARIDTTKAGAASLVVSTYLGGFSGDVTLGVAVD